MKINKIITPDGCVYLAMGQGLHVPRPYSLRPLAYVIPAKAWPLVQYISYAIIAICVAKMAAASQVNPIACVLAVAMLPFVIKSITMPVLLDMPSLACACLCAVSAICFGAWCVVPIMLSVLVTEKTPVWGALYSAMYVDNYWLLGAGVAIAAIVTAIIYVWRKPHTDEQDVEWLREPIKSAIKKHLPVISDWNAWVKPWGGVLIGLAALNVHLALCLVVAYGGCLMAQDRARIYMMACVPMAIAACAIAGDYAMWLPVVNFYTSSNEL